MAAAPWDRREDETPKAFAAFMAYRDMGRERSLNRCSKADGAPTVGLLKRWSSRYEWQARCVAWDRHLDATRQQALKEEVKDWTREALKELREFQIKALERLRTLKADEMTPGEALKFYTEAATLTRRLSGAEDEDRRIQPILYLPSNGRDPVLAGEGEEEATEADEHGVR